MLLFTIIFWIIALVLLVWVWSNSDKLTATSTQTYLVLAAAGFVIGILLYSSDPQALTLIEETGDTNYNVLVNVNSQAIGDKIRVVAGGPTSSSSTSSSSTTTPPTKTYLVNLPTPLNDNTVQVKVSLKGDMCVPSGNNKFDCTAQTNVSASRTFVVASTMAIVNQPSGSDPLIPLGSLVDNSSPTPLTIAGVSSLGQNNLIITVNPGSSMFTGTLACQLITTSPTDGLVVIQDVTDVPNWTPGSLGSTSGSTSWGSYLASGGKTLSINGAKLKKSRR
jgi:hypothetical protein